MRRPTTSLASLAALATLVLAGCGDTTSDDGSPAASGGASDCETVTVQIPEFAFAPDPVEISACDSVVWENTHTQAHTSTGQGAQQWSTGNIAAGATSDPVTFEAPGELTYICALHPFMTGTVLVS
ncbi:MAG: cupredoxin domain-containing protein [Acidimicrobiales bacterium]